MRNKQFIFPDEEAFKFVKSEFKKRGITYQEIAEIAYKLQKSFIPNAKIPEYKEAVIKILHKREVLNSAMVALELDRLATEKKLKQPLQKIIENDAAVFGVDEAIAESIANIYGTIGITNFGYLDRVKHGIIKKLDTEKKGKVNTFVDDLIGALASAVAAKMAHRYA